jgi:hypothetical protein
MSGQSAKEGVAAISRKIKSVENNSQTKSNGANSGAETNQQVKAVNKKQQC